MQLTQNTSIGKTKRLLFKIILVLIIVIGTIAMLGKIEFPSPNKDIKKIIPNEKLKIVK